MGVPYVHCWAHELPGGVLANPNYMEWRLCDGCKHVCCDEGRNCCEGRGEWAGMWFCRKCWMRWQPLSDEVRLPHTPSLPPHSLSVSGPWAGSNEFPSVNNLDAQLQPNPTPNGHNSHIQSLPNALLRSGNVPASNGVLNLVDVSPVAGDLGLAPGFPEASFLGLPPPPPRPPVIRGTAAAMLPATTNNQCVAFGDSLTQMHILPDLRPHLDLQPLLTPPLHPPQLKPFAETESSRKAERRAPPSDVSVGGKSNGTSSAVRGEHAASDRLHPLMHEWCFWLLMNRGGSGANWSDALKCVHGPVSFVEDFWRLFHNVHPPSAICNADYSLFQNGITPARGDPAVSRGGRWILAIGNGSSHRGRIRESRFAEVLDHIWVTVLLSIIGNVFATGGCVQPVCGAVISVKCSGGGGTGSSAEVDAAAATPRNAKLAVWLRDASDEERVRAVGVALQEILVSSVPESDMPRGGWHVAFEDFLHSQVTCRI